jgi:hypothetical protein
VWECMAVAQRAARMARTHPPRMLVLYCFFVILSYGMRTLSQNKLWLRVQQEQPSKLWFCSRDHKGV